MGPDFAQVATSLHALTVSSYTKSLRDPRKQQGVCTVDGTASNKVPVKFRATVCQLLNCSNECVLEQLLLHSSPETWRARHLRAACRVTRDLQRDLVVDSLLSPKLRADALASQEHSCITASTTPTALQLDDTNLCRCQRRETASKTYSPTLAGPYFRDDETTDVYTA